MVLIFCNLLPNDKYSNLLIVAAFSIRSFSSKTSWPIRISYLLTFPDDKVEILAVCLSNFFLPLFCAVIDCFHFFINSHFIISSSEVLMVYLAIKLYRSLKMKMAFSIIFVKLPEIF